MNKRAKAAYTAVAAVMLLLLYFAIFNFSAQDGEDSGSLSRMISRLGVELWNDLTGRHWTENFMTELAVYFEHPLRKLAHFTEYAVMGFLVRSLWAVWGKWEKKWFFCTGIWVAVSAAADELHQYFVPGRCGNVPDVLLDTCGGLFGAAVCIFLFKLVKKKK